MAEIRNYDLALFENTLRASSRQPIRFRWHQNRHTMITVTPMSPIGWKLSLHKGFAQAPDEILHAFRLFLNTRRKSAWASIRQYASSIHIAPSQLSKPCITRGQVYDLAHIQHTVERKFFDETGIARISWKTFRSAHQKRPRKSIRFGQYDPVENLITINSLLDQEKVAPDFVEFIVYHETLHALLPPIQQGSRTVYHHTEFRRRERAFPEFARMQKLADTYLKSL